MATQKESYDQTPETHLKSNSTGAGGYRSPITKTGGWWLCAHNLQVAYAQCSIEGEALFLHKRKKK